MIKILQGDAVAKLKEIDDGSINTCVTSPPYWGLRDYGQEDQLGLEDTPEEFTDNMVKIFREVRRCLRDDGTLWLNLGDSYSSGGRTTTTNQTLRGSKDYGATRPKPSKNIKPKDLIGIPWRVALALQADGWYLRQDIIWHKPNPMPESVKDRCTKAHEYIFLLSKKPRYYYDHEAIKEDAKSAGKKAMSPQGWDISKGQGGHGAFHKDGRSNEFYEFTQNPKKNKRSVWTVTTKPFKGAHFATFPQDLIEPCILAGCPKKICVDCNEPYKRITSRKSNSLKVDDSTLDRFGNGKAGVHRKVGGQYQKWLNENPLITIGWEKQCDCQTNATKIGTVLDPFAGSGTTGLVANNHKRNAVLIELNPDYIKIIKERCGVEYP